MKMSAFVDPTEPLKKLAGGFEFLEGPVWFADKQALYFNDIPASITRRWSENRGVEILRSPNDKSNGMFRDHDGHLVVCQHGRRRLVKWCGGEKLRVIADTFAGARLNSPNDVVVRSDGSIYFTDPPYGLTADFGEPGEQELPYQGVFRTTPDRSEILLVSDRFYRPNGLAFSTDEKRLYVNDSEDRLIKVYDVTTAGDLSNERLFAEVRGDAPGVPDGMKVDSEENVYVTGPGGVWILGPNGCHVGVIEIPEVVANFTFGGPDNRTLFFAASTSLYSRQVRIAG